MKKINNEKQIFNKKNKKFNKNLLLNKIIQFSSFININENLDNCNLNTLSCIDYININKNDKQYNKNIIKEFNQNNNNYLNLKKTNIYFYNKYIKNKTNNNFYENILLKKGKIFTIKNIQCIINIPHIKEEYSNNLNNLKIINEIKKNRLQKLKEKFKINNQT